MNDLPPDDHCPFCKTALNPGATVCHACGAYYDEQGIGRSKGIVNIGLVIIALFGVFVVCGLQAGHIGYVLVFSIPCIFGGWLVHIGAKDAETKVWKSRT